MSLYAFTRVCERLQEFACVCMRSRESASVHKSLRAFVCVHESLRAFTRVCVRLYAFTRVCERLQEFACVCMRSRESASVHKSLHAFVCVHERAYGQSLMAALTSSLVTGSASGAKRNEGMSASTFRVSIPWEPRRAKSEIALSRLQPSYSAKVRAIASTYFVSRHVA